MGGGRRECRGEEVGHKMDGTRHTEEAVGPGREGEVREAGPALAEGGR